MRRDSPNSWAYIASIFVYVFFPFPLSAASLSTLAASALYTWALLLHEYLPARLAASYSRLTTPVAIFVFPFLLAVVLGLTLLVTYFSSSESERVERGQSPGVVGFVVIYADMAGQLGFAARFWWDLYHKRKADKEAEKKEEEGGDGEEFLHPSRRTKTL